MNDTHNCDYVTRNRKVFQKNESPLKQDINEACLKKKEFVPVNKNTDIGILKEQKCFNDSNKLDNYLNLCNNKNYRGCDFVFLKKDNLLPDLNDISKVCDTFIKSDPTEEYLLFAKEKLFDSKENNEVNFQSISLKTNDELISKKCQPKKANDLPKVPEIKAPATVMSEPNEMFYYAVYIPTEFSLTDALVDKKAESLVYTDKEEVLKVLKLNKKARFKQFKNKKEAEEFAINGAEILPQEVSSALTDNEKIMPFKRPKTEEMIQFRKDIERGDIQAVQEKIFENPKYLVSNGDTPSILQEGSRYNALHVAAKAKNAKITQLILDSITRIDFIGYLYDDNDIESCITRSEILLDRYLNTPDKGFNETPLHLAVKHGAVEVVQVLSSYSQCQKNNIYNRYNELPKDIICSRVYGPCEETKATIASMLDEQFFVPVLRSEDNSIQPRVGEAFSLGSPLKLQSDFLSPRLEIQAYAGPMSKEKAELFKKKWKTPSRSVKDLNSSLSSRLRDTEKGLEKTGRNLAFELKVPWQEYWSFLDTFIDISSQKGLQLLENYLKNRFQETFESINKEKDAPSRVDLNENSVCSINELCETFELCGSQEKQSENSTLQSRRDVLTPDILHREHFVKKTSESVKNYGKNSLVYVERSCEVFGKRIGAAISSCVLYDSQTESLKECLETQAKHLLSLIKSYKDDIRFQSVDFQLIHSRVAAVAIQSIQGMTKKDKQLILTALKDIRWSDGAVSDDEDLNYNCKNYNNEWSGIITKQLHCVVKHLIMQLRDFKVNIHQFSPSALDKNDCQMLWSMATPCECSWGANVIKRTRSGLKRKQCRSDCESDCDVSPRKILFEEEEISESMNLEAVIEVKEDIFSTPTSGNSDSEDMEDVKEIPNTFIFPGSVPTKIDFAVLEAINKLSLSSDQYPNIYLWRHILQMQPKSILFDHYVFSPDSFQKKPCNFDSLNSSPRKMMDKSSSSCESPSAIKTVVEPWERVTGPYSPRRTTRPLPLFFCESPLMNR